MEKEHIRGKFQEYDLEESQVEKLHFFHHLYFDRIGRFQDAFQHYMSRRDPDFYLVILCTKGRGVLTLDGKTHEISSGSILFTFPGIPHTYYADKEEPWTIYWAHFHAESSEFLPLLEQYGVSPEHPVLYGRDYSELSEDFRKILADIYQCSFSGMCYKQSMFSQLLFQIFYLHAEGERREHSIEQAVEYIHRHLKEPLTLDQIADAVSISKYYLSHRFSAELGISVRQYVLSARIRQAQMLLTSTRKSIREISENCGYENSMYFSNAFRKKTGCSPSAYRKRTERDMG